MKAVSSALLLVVSCGLLLAGCGQKGPLFLPGEARQSQTQGPFGLDDSDSDAHSSTPSADAGSSPDRASGTDRGD